VDLTVTTSRGPRQIRVSRNGDSLHVTVDGREHVLDARRIGEHTLSLLFEGGGGPARSVEVSLSPGADAGAFEVHVGGRVVPVQVHNGHARGARGRPGGGADGGPVRAIAPMPGKIVRVLVKPGDDVRARQGLVVVEAMKMENELRAARDGRVRLVAVEEGQSVEAGTVLVEIEPAPAGEPGR
jgi:biotin carboxyl carrier protein